MAGDRRRRQAWSQEEEENRAALRVQFNVGQFDTRLRGISSEALEKVQEVRLIGLETSEEATHQIGALLPALREMSLRESTIHSFRDFGATGLDCLRVLSAPRCGVTDLDGIGVLSSLEEVYLSFNDIVDCTALVLHESIQVLDLESNNVTEETDLATLGSCYKLSCLSLTNNPIARHRPLYLSLVARHLPQLQFLDDEPYTSENNSSHETQENTLIRQESDVVQEAVKLFRPHSAKSAGSRQHFIEEKRPESAHRHHTSHSCWDEMLRLRGASPTSPSESPAISPSSDLTHGDSASILTGNIVTAIRRKRRGQEGCVPNKQPPFSKPHDERLSSSSFTSNKKQMPTSLSAFQKGRRRRKMPHALADDPATHTFAF